MCTTHHLLYCDWTMRWRNPWRHSLNCLRHRYRQACWWSQMAMSERKKEKQNPQLNFIGNKLTIMTNMQQIILFRFRDFRFGYTWYIYTRTGAVVAQWIRPRTLSREKPGSNLMAAAVAPFCKALYPHNLNHKDLKPLVPWLLACKQLLFLVAR